MRHTCSSDRKGRWVPTQRWARDTVPDDRIHRYTRGLSLFIAPFLLVAFVLLYGFPGETGRLFAWTIRPTMTPMVLASAYLGGFYFFARVLREQRWSAVKLGFPPVTLFATLLGVATLIHWDKFNHGHLAFWLWTGLYFTAPFLVLAAWWRNRSSASAATATEPRVGATSTWLIAIVALSALVTGLVMFGRPGAMIGAWPWALTPLTCRVVGAVLCLGSAGLAVLRDPRWLTLRLMLQVEALMVVLIGIAAVRARDEIHTDRPLTWLMLTGLTGVLAGSGYLWFTHEVTPRRGAAGQQRASTT